MAGEKRRWKEKNGRRKEEVGEEWQEKSGGGRRRMAKEKRKGWKKRNVKGKMGKVFFA